MNDFATYAAPDAPLKEVRAKANRIAARIRKSQREREATAQMPGALLAWLETPRTWKELEASAPVRFTREALRHMVMTAEDAGLVAWDRDAKTWRATAKGLAGAMLVVPV